MRFRIQRCDADNVAGSVRTRCSVVVPNASEINTNPFKECSLLMEFLGALDSSRCARMCAGRSRSSESSAPAPVLHSRSEPPSLPAEIYPILVPLKNECEMMVCYSDGMATQCDVTAMLCEGGRESSESASVGTG